MGKKKGGTKPSFPSTSPATAALPLPKDIPAEPLSVDSVHLEEAIRVVLDL